jgi:hypothetical protein
MRSLQYPPARALSKIKAISSMVRFLVSGNMNQITMSRAARIVMIYTA